MANTSPVPPVSPSPEVDEHHGVSDFAEEEELDDSGQTSDSGVGTSEHGEDKARPRTSCQDVDDFVLSTVQACQDLDIDSEAEIKVLNSTRKGSSVASVGINHKDKQSASNSKTAKHNKARTGKKPFKKHPSSFNLRPNNNEQHQQTPKSSRAKIPARLRWSRLSLPGLTESHRRSQDVQSDACVQTDPDVVELVDKENTSALLRAVSLMQALSSHSGGTWQGLLSLLHRYHQDSQDPMGAFGVYRGATRLRPLAHSPHGAESIADRPLKVQGNGVNDEAEVREVRTERALGRSKGWLGRKRDVPNTPGELAILLGKAQNSRRKDQHKEAGAPSRDSSVCSHRVPYRGTQINLSMLPENHTLADCTDVPFTSSDFLSCSNKKWRSTVQSALLQKQYTCPVLPLSPRQTTVTSHHHPEPSLRLGPNHRLQRQGGHRAGHHRGQFRADGLESSINVTQLPALCPTGSLVGNKSRQPSRGLIMEDVRDILVDTPEAPPGTPASPRALSPVDPTTSPHSQGEPWQGQEALREGSPDLDTLNNQISRVRLPKIGNSDNKDKGNKDGRNSSESVDNCDHDTRECILKGDETFITTEDPNG